MPSLGDTPEEVAAANSVSSLDRGHRRTTLGGIVGCGARRRRRGRGLRRRRGRVARRGRADPRRAHAPGGRASQRAVPALELADRRGRAGSPHSARSRSPRLLVMIASASADRDGRDRGAHRAARDRPAGSRGQRRRPPDHDDQHRAAARGRDLRRVRDAAGARVADGDRRAWRFAVGGAVVRGSSTTRPGRGRVDRLRRRDHVARRARAHDAAAHDDRRRADAGVRRGRGDVAPGLRRRRGASRRRCRVAGRSVVGVRRIAAPWCSSPRSPRSAGSARSTPASVLPERQLALLRIPMFAPLPQRGPRAARPSARPDRDAGRHRA